MCVCIYVCVGCMGCWRCWLLRWWWVAPNEGVCNKIRAPGSSSWPRLPKTPSDWKWNSCDDLIYMLITNGPPENRPINTFLLPPVSPPTQGNDIKRERGRQRRKGREKATVINFLSDSIKTKIIWWRCVWNKHGLAGSEAGRCVWVCVWRSTFTSFLLFSLIFELLHS